MGATIPRDVLHKGQVRQYMGMNRATRDIYSRINILYELRSVLPPEDCAILQRACRTTSQYIMAPALAYDAYITELAKRSEDFSSIKRAKYRAIHIFNGAIIGGSTELCKMAFLWNPSIATLSNIQRGIYVAASCGSMNICTLLLDHVAAMPTSRFIESKLVEKGDIAHIVDCAIDTNRADVAHYIMCCWVANREILLQRSFRYQWHIARIIVRRQLLGLLRSVLEWCVRGYAQGSVGCHDINFDELMRIAIQRDNHEAFRIISTITGGANIAINYACLAHCIIIGESFNSYIWGLIMDNMKRTGQHITFESVFTDPSLHTQPPGVQPAYIPSTRAWWKSSASVYIMCKWIRDTAQIVNWRAICEWARRAGSSDLYDVAARIIAANDIGADRQN